MRITHIDPVYLTTNEILNTEHVLSTRVRRILKLNTCIIYFNGWYGSPRIWREFRGTQTVYFYEKFYVTQ